jgi:hypothetical protein
MMHLSLAADTPVIHVRGERGSRAEIGSHLAFDLDDEMLRFFNPQTEQAVLLEA